MSNLVLSEPEKSAKMLNFITYGLYAISWFTGVTAIIAVIINYVKRDDMRGTFLESHVNWQINTFWFGLLWGVIGVITAFFLIGWVILFFNSIWIIYRVVRGILNLNDNKAMYGK